MLKVDFVYSKNCMMLVCTETIIGPITVESTVINSTTPMIPKASICSITLCTGSGAKAYNNREPSRGGNGIILNTNKLTFTLKNKYK